MSYIAYLHKDQKSDYGVSFPDLPGCVTSGRTLDEARSNATEGLALHLQNMAEDNETIPEPSTIYDTGDGVTHLHATKRLLGPAGERAKGT